MIYNQTKSKNKKIKIFIIKIKLNSKLLKFIKKKNNI
jgi:hypothetical protein